MHNNLTYIVPCDRLEQVRKHLDRIIKRAIKKGLSELDYSVGTDIIHRPQVVRFYDPLNPHKTHETIQIECREVTLSAPSLKLEGWSFVGRIEHLKDDEGNTVNLVYNAPDTSVPAEYRERDQVCDHCETNRYRKDTFIVKHDNGSTKQVGSTCLSDFLGVDAASFMAWASLIQSFTGCVDDKESNGDGGMRERITYSLPIILNLAAATYLHRGYISRRKADDNPNAGMPTGDVVRCYMAASRRGDTKACENLIPSAPSAEWASRGRELSATTEAWVRELPERDWDDLGDYLSNLAVIGRCGYCPEKGVGILVSAVQAYSREQERNAQNAEYQKSEYQGQLKERIVRENVEVILARPTQSSYNNEGGMLYKFKDADGNLYIWFASNKSTNLEVGEKVSFVATVKKHEADRYLGGACVTTLNRVNVDPVAVAKAEKDEVKSQFSGNFGKIIDL